MALAKRLVGSDNEPDADVKFITPVHQVSPRKGTHVRALTSIIILSLALLAPARPARAQEGHPLKGSWIGTWGPSQNHSNDVIVIMNWDGKSITGTINPGSDDIAI